MSVEMTSSGLKTNKSVKLDFIYATVVYSTMFLFITLTFPAYFYFLPSPQDSDIRPLLLGLYLVSWPLALFLPPILLTIARLTRFNKPLLFLYFSSVLFWPLVTLLIKIRSIAMYGSASIEYWGLYPIFVFMELIWPIFVVVFYLVYQRNPSVAELNKKMVKRKLKEQLKAQLAEANSAIQT